MSKLIKLLKILREIKNLNDETDEVIDNDNNTEIVRNNFHIGSSSTHFELKNDDIDIADAQKSEFNSVSNNISYSFRASRFIMSNFSMFTDLSKCQFETYQISKHTVRRSAAQTNLHQNNYSCISLVSTAEEHFSTKLTNSTGGYSSNCSSLIPKLNSSIASLTSLDYRKNSYRPSKLKRSSVFQSVLTQEHSDVEKNGAMLDIEYASTPKKQKPRSSTPKIFKRKNILTVPENTQTSSCSSLSRSSDVFFPTFFSNFVSLINH